MGIAGRKPEVGSDLSIQRAREGVQSGTAESVVLMEPPEDLTPEAARIWEEILPDLIAAKVFRPSDGILLSELCSTLAMARGFRAEIAKLQEEHALALESRDFEGADSLSQMIKRARSGYLQSLKAAMSIAGEFGISPVARLRLGLMQIQGNSLLGALRAQRSE